MNIDEDTFANNISSYCSKCDVFYNGDKCWKHEGK